MLLGTHPVRVYDAVMKISPGRRQCLPNKERQIYIERALAEKDALARYPDADSVVTRWMGVVCECARISGSIIVGE